jgi:hypothetical protein
LILTVACRGLRRSTDTGGLATGRRAFLFPPRTPVLLRITLARPLLRGRPQAPLCRALHTASSPQDLPRRTRALQPIHAAEPLFARGHLEDFPRLQAIQDFLNAVYDQLGSRSASTCRRCRARAVSRR